MTNEIKLHIGGQQPKEGWKILNIMAGPDVDITGSCTDLSLFPDGSVDEVYASHVLEHLNAQEITIAMAEISRVMKPGGVLKGSVPDMNVLCRLYMEAIERPAEQVKIMHMIYGGHVNEFDIHHFGFNFTVMAAMLGRAGFSRIDQVDFLNEFTDTSSLTFNGVLISLNFIATK